VRRPAGPPIRFPSAGSRVLGIEAGKTLILLKDEVIRKADESDMTIVGL
jgi:DUF1009 family protein